jgi:glycosyltransferase involved in cell wall biosynthesis
VLGIDSIPRVVEDLELSMIWNKVRAQRTWLGRARHGLTWWKLRHYAASLLSQIEGCTVCSEQERSLLQSIAPDFESLSVIPNGLDTELYDEEWGSRVPDTLIYPGALTYQANFDAMAFFLKDVFPLIRAQAPGVTLRITGRTDGVPTHRLPIDDGVILTGYLADVRPTIAQSAVCVVPLLSGGGTRLKILEAMALGTPVVSTLQGAEGLRVTPGQDILIADDPGTFAHQVLRLLASPELQSRLARAGRRLVRENYDWAGIGSRLNAFLESVVFRWQEQKRAAHR